MSEVRTRFSPSPTGYLHIGGARTALFNWLFARRHGGTFVLRIEDTDVARSTEEATRAILDGLKWLGIDWDEGPYFQSQRLDIYQSYIDRLVSEGKAYYCSCSPEELDARRKAAMAEGRKPKYDGTCRNRRLEKGPNTVVRFRAPEHGTTVVHDLVKGATVFDNAELDDLIIQRSDGMPTYNFAVVIDDISMEITHVIRGDDHLNNTPRQILLYEALGWPAPEFAHVPMILGADKSRLSKRHGATSVLAYKEMGYLPQAMLNYLTRLGWSHGDQEIFSREELIEKFSLENVGKSAGIFNPDKLLWLNAHYIKEEDPNRLARLVLPFLEQHGIKVEDVSYLAKAIPALQPRSKTLVEMAGGMPFYFKDELDYEEKAARKFLTPDIKGLMQQILEELKGLPLFRQEDMEATFERFCAEKDIKFKQIAQPLRLILTGKTVSPGLFELMEVLGPERVVKRLERGIKYLASTV
ncbi:MAG: glutamate--tRNA ligase [Desulfovibrionales bacterium]|nr:glutamate--tRNA ligase [Desulfovibrionales bacterium]